MKLTIGEKIRMHRMLRRMTRIELAKYLRMSEQAIGLYERNEREPNVEVIKKLAQLFEVTTDYLLCFEPLTPSERVWSMIELSDDEILEKIMFTFEGKPLSKKHAEFIIQQVRSIRSLFPEE